MRNRSILLAAALSALGAAPSPFMDYRGEAPGVRHRITAADLPAPYATESANNGPDLVKRPDGAWPRAPKGFTVGLYADGLDNPRQIRTAPNGDVFVAESAPGRIRVLRGIGADGKARTVEVFATGLKKPFGIAFSPPGPDPKFVYVGETDEIVRFAYKSGDLKAGGPAEKIADIPGGGNVDGGHWTRDVAFSRDGRKMFVSVGSHSNVNDPDDHPDEKLRADVLEFDPRGKNARVYAWGLRNPVGLAVNPKTGELWASVNERDRLGDNLVPDYITHLSAKGFYGWPWYYIGSNSDPRLPGKHPELKDKVLVPDVLIQPHDASLGIVFYAGKSFPAEYSGDLFAAEHGSWNRATRTGYEVVRVPMKNGRAADGGYEDFLTGFVTPEGQVWGRPVGVAVASDGALLVTDDASGTVWRVSRAARSPAGPSPSASGRP
jgi:glucose/arabinose dehydrogenase